MRPRILESPPTWRTPSMSALPPRFVPPMSLRSFPPAPLEHKPKAERYSSKPWCSTNNRQDDQPLPTGVFCDGLVAAFFGDFLAEVFFAAFSPAIGRSLMSAARHMYQPA